MSALRAGFCFMGAACGVGVIASATRPGPIDPAPALHRRALAHFPDPVSQVGISLYLQKFAGFAEPSIDQRSLPGPSGNVGNAVPVTGKVMRLRKRAIPYIELAFDRHGEPVHRVLDPGRRAGEEAPETAAETRRAARSPEQPADRLDPFRRASEETRQIFRPDTTRSTSIQKRVSARVPRSFRAGIVELGLTCTKPQGNGSPSVISIGHGSYSAP